MMARALSPEDRVALFHGVLRAMIDVTSPDALVFKHSQQVVAPADYLAACSEDPIVRPGSINVRFFNISNSDGDMLMDTRGLTEIGLHDLQCHFRDLEPDDVSRVLYNTALYIFEKGPVIESDGGGKRTRLEVALPIREFAAGAEAGRARPEPRKAVRRGQQVNHLGMADSHDRTPARSRKLAGP
jgi:hypothetical protein